MDLTEAIGVNQLNVEKATQIGVSDAMRNVLGRRAHLAPEPCGLTLPSEQKGRKLVSRYVLPMFRATAPLAEQVASPRDLKSDEVALQNGFVLHLMWAGSASSMASDPMALVICDETDKYEEWAGREADPVELSRMRTTSYRDRALAVNVSTPTDRHGPIHRLIEASDVQLRYTVPCPHCGEYQELTWPQVRWPAATEADKDDKVDRARRVRRGRVWVECRHCRAEIDESDKPAMVRAGRWSSADGTIPDALAVDRWPQGTSLGCQISALVCLWIPWTQLAAESIRAQGDRDRQLNFRTQRLGLPYEESIARVHHSLFAAKVARAELDAGVVPNWAHTLLATADTQADHFYVVLRAWGAGLRSQRVWHGTVRDFADVERIAHRQIWPYADSSLGGLAGDRVIIDTGGTGTRTMQVYQWAAPRHRWVVPIKGASGSLGGLYFKPGKGWLDRGGSRSSRRGRRSRTVQIYLIDSHHFQDLLADLILDGIPEENVKTSKRQNVETSAPEARGLESEAASVERWSLNRQADPVYDRQMAALHKVIHYRGSRAELQWLPIQPGARHDYRDCEAYQVFGAYLLRLDQLNDATVAAHLDARRESSKPQDVETSKQKRPSPPTARRPSDAWRPKDWGGKIR